MEVVQISDLSPSHTGLPSMSPLNSLTVFTASLTYLAGKRVPYLQLFLFQLALSLFSDFVTERVKTRRILFWASRRVRLKDQGNKGAKSWSPTQSWVLHSPGLHQRIKPPLSSFGAFRAEAQARHGNHCVLSSSCKVAVLCPSPLHLRDALQPASR